MPPKNCARCQKIVYPTEELKCLDQTWHKLCFKCEECGMSLSVKTFKAFDKKPYCPAHCPKLQATFIADTPEARRLAENTKIQSQVQYHSDFERAKGQYLQIGLEDPEIQRVVKVANIVSNVKYHEDFEKQKGTKTTVVDEPELQRIRQNTALQSGVAYKGLVSKRDEMETRRPTEREIDDVAEISQQLAASRIMGPPQPVPVYNGNGSGTNGYHNGYQNGTTNGYTNGHNYSPDSMSPSDRNNFQQKNHTTTIYSREEANGWVPGSLSPTTSNHSNQEFSHDYSRPVRDFRQAIRSFDNGGVGYNTEAYYTYREQEEQQQLYPSAVPQQQRMAPKVGSIADYDPVNGQWGTIGQAGPPPQQPQPQQQQVRVQQQPQQQPQPQMASPGIVSRPPQQQSAPQGMRYRAMYDYDAQEEDEASFYMDDQICNVRRIDEGWVVGTVARTNRTGMIPANYIEPCA